MKRFENLRRVLLAEHARFVVRAEIQFRQWFEFQIEQVERFLDEAAFDEFLGDDAAQRFDVERLAVRKILHAPGLLRRTTRDVLAAPGDFLGVATGNLFLCNRPAASRAFAADVFEQVKFLRAGRTFGFHHLENFRDDHAGLADDHGVADADVFAADFVLVVERGARNRGALHEDRFKFSHGREHAGAPDLHGDGL